MKQNQQEKVVIILSGGLDSTIALHVSRQEYNIFQAIIFFYGQK